MIGALAITAAVAAEALVIYVIAAWWGVSYSTEGQHAVNGVTIVLATMTAFGLPRFLGNLEIPVHIRWAIAGVVTWLVLYGALRIEFGGDLALWDFSWIPDFVRDPSGTTQDHTDVVAGGIILTVAWSWGLFRSEADIDLEFIPKQLGGGFAAVTLIAIFASTASAADEVARGAAAFYAVAVIALALSQSARSGATIGALRTTSITGVLLAGTFAAVLVCLAVFGLLWGPLAPPLGHAIGAVLQVVLLIIFTPPAWVLAQVIGLIFGDGAGQNVLPAVNDAAQVARDPASEDPSGIEQIVVYAARAFFLLVAVGVIAGLVKLFLRFRRRTHDVPVAPAARGSAGSLAEDLRNLFRGRPRRHGNARQEDDAAVRLYLTVLDEAARRGHDRPVAATPGEFKPELNSTFQVPVTDEITAAFEEARYAGRRVDPSKVADLEHRWRSSH